MPTDVTRFLDEAGLQQVIHMVHSDTIQALDYSDVVAAGSSIQSGSIFFLKLALASEKEPWIVKYRVSSKIGAREESAQSSEVVVGGVGNIIGYYRADNAVYNKLKASATNHAIAVRGDMILFGLDITSSFTYRHDLHVEVSFVKGGNATLYSQAKTLAEIFGAAHEGDFTLRTIDFSESGIVDTSTSGGPSAALATVAYTGSYSDLQNKPQILEPYYSAANEALIFQ